MEKKKQPIIITLLLVVAVLLLLINYFEYKATREDCKEAIKIFRNFTDTDEDRLGTICKMWCRLPKKS